jgi:hypothetical protein
MRPDTTSGCSVVAWSGPRISRIRMPCRRGSR